jgi:hypothetical protein
MPIFNVAWTELYAFQAKVTAKDLDHAIELVKDDPSFYAGTAFEGEYVDGSMEINLDYTQWLNSEEGKKAYPK